MVWGIVFTIAFQALLIGTTIHFYPFHNGLGVAILAFIFAVPAYWLGLVAAVVRSPLVLSDKAFIWFGYPMLCGGAWCILYLLAFAKYGMDGL